MKAPTLTRAPNVFAEFDGVVYERNRMMHILIIRPGIQMLNISSIWGGMS